MTDETPSERQGRPIPISDDQVWSQAMSAYNHARDLGLSRLESAEAFRPLLQHPSLSTSAQLMLDIARSDHA